MAKKHKKHARKRTKEEEAFLIPAIIKMKEDGCSREEMSEKLNLTVRQIDNYLSTRRTVSYSVEPVEQKPKRPTIKSAANDLIADGIEVGKKLFKKAAGPDGGFEGLAPRDAIQAATNLAKMAVDVKRIEEPPPQESKINITAESAQVIGQEVKNLYIQGAEAVGDEVYIPDGADIALAPEVLAMLEHVPEDEDVEEDDE